MFGVIILTLDEIKLYLRAGDDDDITIAALMAAATGYVNGQTGKTQVKTGVDADNLPVYDEIATDELYNQAIKLMVAHWYENRGVEVPGQLTRISHSVDALVSHISLCGDYI